MATSIYAMSYLEYITKGLFDYHKIYDQEIDVSELDVILKAIIKNVGIRIYQYDKVYTRDKTMVEACWEFVKRKVELSQTTLNSDWINTFFTPRRAKKT